MKNVRIVYRLLAESGVLIGSTANVLSIDLGKSTMRRRRYTGQSKPSEQQEPIIPGSTLKGKVRNECERILASLNQEVCHAPRAETMCPHDPAVTTSPCAVCQLFGGPSHQSRLFFSDAVVKADPSLAPFLVRVQTGVALSRQRRTAEEERLYYVERGIEGVVYQGEIDGYLDDDRVSQQLALVITAFARLVAIGGGKSRGAGWTKFELVDLAIDGQSVGDEERQKMQAEGFAAWRVSK